MIDSSSPAHIAGSTNAVVSSTSAHSKQIKRLEKVAQDFETLFANMLLKSMYKSVDTSDSVLAQNGTSQKIFNGMLHEEYGKELARAKSLGIADTIIDYYKNSV